ncbi:MAG: hypothetical protein GX814_02595 [Microbacteriaceae bacterium]|nr:hypothetical protein [Microbacteriaceae bacterium]
MTLAWQAIDGSQLPAVLAAQLAASRLELWHQPGESWAPRTIVVSDASGAPVAAALVTSRPYNAYRKIADVVVADGLLQPAFHAAFRVALEGVLAEAQASPDRTRPIPMVIWFEEHPQIAPLGDNARAELAAQGFIRDEDPVPSIPSTVSGDPHQVHRWSRWLAPAPAATRAVPYYGQTTDVTCGAVAALTALEGAGLGRFGVDGESNHSHELSFWRRATNLPACEPIGLSVTTASEIGAHTHTLGIPRVILSTDDYVLLEDWVDDPLELRLRTQLQQESLREAERLGVAIERRWISVEEIRDLVSDGAYVLLLIDLEPLIADPTPHWVLAHDVIADVDGREFLVVTDPWVEAARGESWADTSAAPLSLEGIDLITRWGDPQYRGVIVVPRIG